MHLVRTGFGTYIKNTRVVCKAVLKKPATKQDSDLAAVTQIATISLVERGFLGSLGFNSLSARPLIP
jgi:hypothetical protein